MMKPHQIALARGNHAQVRVPNTGIDKSLLGGKSNGRHMDNDGGRVAIDSDLGNGIMKAEGIRPANKISHYSAYACLSGIASHHQLPTGKLSANARVEKGHQQGQQ